MDNSLVQYAEVGVLSLSMRNPQLIKKVSGQVRPHMFTSTVNKTLFSVLADLSESGIHPDYGTLMTTLQAKDLVAECGGDGYLQYLMNQDYNPANLDELSRNVVNGYKSRQLVTLATNLHSMLTTTDNVDSTLTYANTFLENLGSLGSPDSVTSFKDATSESWEMLLNRANSEEKIKVTTGIQKLDEVTGGFFPGDLWVFAGRPGMGKSAIMCNSALSGVPTLIFSREMSRDSLVQRLISIKSGVPVFNLRLGAINQQQLDAVQNTIAEIKDLPIFIDTNFSKSIEYIVSTIIKYHELYGIKIAHLDYLQLLVDREDNATNELGRITRNLKLLSNNIGLTTVCYSQLNRAVEMRQDKRPILSDLRQSGNIEEDADVVTFIYRDVMYNPKTSKPSEIELLLLKQRNGPTGTLFTHFDEVTNRIYD